MHQLFVIRIRVGAKKRQVETATPGSGTVAGSRIAASLGQYRDDTGTEVGNRRGRTRQQGQQQPDWGHGLFRPDFCWGSFSCFFAPYFFAQSRRNSRARGVP